MRGLQLKLEGPIRRHMEHIERIKKSIELLDWVMSLVKVGKR